MIKRTIKNSRKEIRERNTMLPWSPLTSTHPEKLRTLTLPAQMTNKENFIRLESPFKILENGT